MTIIISQTEMAAMSGTKQNDDLKNVHWIIVTADTGGGGDFGWGGGWADSFLFQLPDLTQQRRRSKNLSPCTRRSKLLSAIVS